ncbi:MAG: dTDP-4-dehydrorhamnose reductase [Pyrinomonadaceae bacterium]
MKVIVTGAGGLVGRAAVAAFAARDGSVMALDHAALDITDEAAVVSTLLSRSPEVVINCAAWTDVDGCEFDRDRAHGAHARGPEVLALACRKVGALLITISTDYVFDGEKQGFYTQRDQPNPKSIYAASKLEGERRAQAAWARTIVVRSGYIFGAGGTNFLSTVLERARRGEKLKAINDSFGTPTYAPHLAQRLYRLTALDLPGIFHIVNAGEGVSFDTFARTALNIAGLDDKLLESVPLASLNRPAPRPRNSRLKCLLCEAVRLEPLPLWTDGLRDFVTGGHGANQSQAS